MRIAPRPEDFGRLFAKKTQMDREVQDVPAEVVQAIKAPTLTMVQMPAMNTPQFGWVKSRLPHKAQPVPPIYQPEVGARAVYWAAHHKRREVYVGASTVIVIIGNKFVPGLGDWYLSRTGYKGQQTGEPENPHRPDNLYEPVNSDPGAHGTFDKRAKDSSLQVWANLHRGRLGLSAAALVGLSTLIGRRIK